MLQAEEVPLVGRSNFCQALQPDSHIQSLLYAVQRKRRRVICRARRAAAVNDTYLTDPTESLVLAHSPSLNSRCCFITAGTRATPTKVNKQTHLNMCGGQRRHRAPRDRDISICEIGSVSYYLGAPCPRRWTAPPSSASAALCICRLRAMLLMY